MQGFLRGTATYLLGTALFFMLFIFAYFTVFTQITANPGQVKHALEQSGVYKNIPAVIYDNSVDSGATTSASIPLKSPVVRQAVIDTFNPAFVQKSIESAIDGTYGWLDGKTSSPKFTIDLKIPKDNLAKNLSDRVSKLPVCTGGGQAKMAHFDPYSSVCLPAGTDTAALRKEIYEQTAKSDNFLKDTEIDASSIKDADGKPVFQNYSDIPKTYQAALKIPYLAAIACLLLGAGTIYASRTKKEGARKIGKILLGSGFFVAFVPLAVNRLIENIIKSSGDDKVVSDIAGPIVSELSRSASKVYFAVGAIYVLLAIAIFVLTDRYMPKETVKKQEK